ncbi:RNA polymerase sigma factor [Gaoshiqia sediminis]|uniref:RNA polymerase sigma factor n=1 Tax=Gaoshiqia sediminis TaxID=2986998 RepID=A0AA42C9B6_9BACT|nr:RNA polymerase sigma factor [Gaoshiqia sediminis]MCW0481925.1 RNA polymerase sigma factor [Gaoshiqia sediminis]
MVSMEQKDDHYYIDQVLNGNAAAYSYLVEKYQDMVYGLALKMLRNAEDAEELAQDSFVKAYRSLSSYKQKSKFSTWLYSITYNGCITMLRKRKMEIRSLDEQHLTEQDEIRIYDQLQEINKAELEKYLQEALSKLPELDQVLVTLYYYEDQKVEEICQITGLSESNVKVKIHRARKKMYELLSSYFKEEIYSLF